MRAIPSLIAIASAMQAVSSASAQENASTVFRPNSAWAVEYGEDYCRLARSFGDGDKRITLAMERIQPRPTARLLLLGDGIRTSRRATTIGFSFTPAREPREARILLARTADGGSMYNLGIVYLAKPSDSATREQQRELRGRYSRDAERAYGRSVDGLLIDRGVFGPVWLETGELAAPLEALQACADELVTHWGLDAEKHRNLRRPVAPANEMVAWLPSGTVPPSEGRLLGGGQNVVRLSVDAAGRATACGIHFASLPDEVNQRVCSALLQYARFEPARDSADQAIDSYWVTELGPLLAPRRR